MTVSKHGSRDNAAVKHMAKGDGSKASGPVKVLVKGGQPVSGKATKAAPVKATKAAPVKAAPADADDDAGNRRTYADNYAGLPDGAADALYVTVKADGNPKRAGSSTYDRFALYRTGMTVQAALDAGLTRADVKWDLAHGHIAVSASKPAGGAKVAKGAAVKRA